MAKKSKKNKNTANNVNIVLPDSLSAEEMKNILVEAMLEVEQRKAELANTENESDLKEWRKSLGIKEYPADKKIRFRKIKQVCNTFYAFFKLSFIPKNQIKGDRATIGLLKFFLCAVFDLAKIMLTLWSVCLIAIIPLQYFIQSLTPLSISENIFVFCFAFMSFVLSRLFRIASAEIDRIDDKNFLFGVFASITSIVSIIIAVVSIFYKGV